MKFTGLFMVRNGVFGVALFNIVVISSLFLVMEICI